ncbi:3908_t:CDS:2, partial [Racocetra persica]
GAGYTFGGQVVKKFLEINQMEHILRAHQLCMEGFQATPNYCYRCGNMASILEVGVNGQRFFNVFDAAPENDRDGPSQQMSIERKAHYRDVNNTEIVLEVNKGRICCHLQLEVTPTILSLLVSHVDLPKITYTISKVINKNIRMIASISSKFSENNSTDVSDSSVIMQQNRQSPKQSRTHPDTSSDSGSQQGVRRSRRTSLREKQTNYAEATSSSSSESEVKLGVRRRRLSSHKSGEDSVSSSNSDLESRPIVKRVRSSRDSQSPKKSSSSSLSEISENYLSSAPDTESETQEPPSPPETPSLPLQKRHSSQSESSDDTSEDTDRTSEPPSPPGTPVPYDPCKICGGFDDPLDSQYPLLIAMEYPTVNQWEEAGAVTHVLMEEFAEQLNRPEGVNNAMKRTNGNNWVHVLCATFIPETSFYDAENVFLVMDIEDIRDESWNAICSICQMRGGACIRCSNYACKKFLHTTCAQEAGCNIGFELKSPKLDFSQQG